MIPSREEIRASLEERHGKEMQEKLEAAEVAICGLGGLGSAIAIALSRAGVGKLHLIDFDRVDLSNINRQQYSLNEIGMAKTDAMEKEIRRYSPYCNVKKTFVKLTEENVQEVLKSDKIICEAFDRAEEKAMLTNAVLEKLPGSVLVGASGMAGCGSSNEIVTRKVMKNYYICGDGISEISEGNGLMAPRVMICAAHQANMVIRIISGKEEA